MSPDFGLPYRVAAVFALMTAVACAQQCPEQPPVVINSPQVPSDVCLPAASATASPEDQLPYFDDYSWRTFLAMVWPAKAGERGVPDAARKPDGSGPVVFQTLKALWELLHPVPLAAHCCGKPSADWNQYEVKASNACGVPVAFGGMVMGSFSKFSDLGEAGFGNLSGPIEAQNRTYLHYVVAFNRIQFEHIIANQLYLADNLQGVSFPNGALDVKSAWMDMANVAHKDRYYRVKVTVQDPTGKCQQEVEMGLVGLHIVQKTPSRPHWIWSTFEHIDNAPPAPTGAMEPYAFYRNGAPPMPATNLIRIHPEDDPAVPWPPPANAYNLERSKQFPIHEKTAAINLAYRAALKQAGSMWQYYQLVMTQFPLSPAGNDAFPGLSTFKTAIANLTMETFNQDGISAVSCLACHNSRENDTDFVWSLYDRSKGTILLKQKISGDFRDLLSQPPQERKQ
jgi:hypothetical protein